jgi:hypothetical protein
LAGVATEDERPLERTPHIRQTLDDTLGHLIDEKVNVTEAGRRPLAAFSEETAVEEFRRGVGD